MGKVVYLTGAPATGKSSLCDVLKERIKDIAIFCYSAELRDYVNQRHGGLITETSIREQSAAIVTREDVIAVDKLLIDFVNRERKSRDIIIDSHAVTKEAFGFRVTSFSVDQLKQLCPDRIICLYADSDVIATRISTDPKGRPLPTKEEIEIHTQTQISVTTQYGILLGQATFLIDTDIPRHELADHICKIASLGAHHNNAS